MRLEATYPSHDARHGIGDAHGNNNNCKVGDKDAGDVPETTSNHAADDPYRNFRSTHNTVRMPGANINREESDKVEVSVRMGGTFEATRNYAADDTNGDIGAAHYAAYDIGVTQENNDSGNTDASARQPIPPELVETTKQNAQPMARTLPTLRAIAMTQPTILWSGAHLMATEVSMMGQMQ